MTQLYRHFDGNGTLLYVGISSSTIARLSQHQRTAHWFDQVTNVSVQKFPTRKDALEAEKLAIQTECPLYNKVHNNVHNEDIWASDIDAQIAKEHQEVWTDGGGYTIKEYKTLCSVGLIAPNELTYGNYRSSYDLMKIFEAIMELRESQKVSEIAILKQLDSYLTNSVWETLLFYLANDTTNVNGCTVAITKNQLADYLHVSKARISESLHSLQKVKLVIKDEPKRITINPLYAWNGNLKLWQDYIEELAKQNIITLPTKEKQ
jgi:hypothetical protein